MPHSRSPKTLVRSLLRRLGLEVHYVGVRHVSRPSSVPSPSVPYIENPEIGPLNLSEKEARLSAGGPFEWPNIVALNKAVAALVSPSLRIVELGAGTGAFALEASSDPARSILASELDPGASQWASANRSRPNVRYIDRMPTPADGPFDLVVSVEVIEHVADYVSFLRLCASLAPRAILTTPNRSRGPKFNLPGPPPLAKHVREWTAGEFYWVLRCFYSDVRLYSLPNPYVPEMVPITVTDDLSPLVADCRNPIPPRS